MTASRFGRRPRRDVRRPAPLVGVNGPRLFMEALEDRATPAFNPNPLFVTTSLPAPTSQFGSNVNGAPTAIAVGDFNGDGEDDFAALPVTNTLSTVAPRIDVYLSKTTGAGYNYQAISTGSGFYDGGIVQRGFTTPSLAAVDVTADGKDEIAVVSQTTGEALVYQLSNTGTFLQLASTQFDYDTGMTPKPNLALGGVTGGDFNNDGKGDLFVSLTGSPNGNQYFVLLNNGNGRTFTPVPSVLKTGSTTTSFTKPITADFNGDGNADVAMVNAATSQAVVLFGDGAAGFTFSRLLPVAATPTAVAVGDFDHSGTRDLAVGLSNGTVTLFLKDNTGTTGTTFTTKANAVTLGGGAKVVGLAAADYDVDTFDDLAIVSTRSTTSLQNVDVYLGSADVSNVEMIAADGSPYSSQMQSVLGGAVATFDYDNNGNADFVVGSGTTSGQQYTPFLNQSGVGGETFLTADKTASEFGLPVSYSVVIYPPPLGGPLPTGSVSFFDVTTDTAGNQTFTNVGSNTLSPSLDSQGSSIAVTTFQKADFSVGQHTVVAKYSGDANYATTTSNTQVVTVSKATAVATLTTPIPPTAASAEQQLAGDKRTLPRPVFGQPVPLTVQLTSAAGLFPPGDVSFFDNGNQIGSATVDATGTATITVPNFSLGDHGISVEYAGSGNFTAATSNGLSIAVAKANSTTSLSASKAALTFGDPVTLTAQVGIAAPGIGTPTGIVEFYEGTTKVGTANVIASSGVASFSVTGLPVGSHTFTATYTGNTSVATSQSVNTVTVSVTGTGSLAGLVADPTTSNVGAPVTLTAFVTDTQSPPRPVSVGTVTFVGTDGNGQPVTLGPVNVTNGQAATTYSGLPLGTATFKAVFSGTDSIAPATSPAVTVVTQKATPRAFLIAPDNTDGTAVLGQDVQLLASFRPSEGLSAVPTGTITFLDGTTVLGTAATDLNGAAFTTVRLTRGLHTVTAKYSGDGVYGPAEKDLQLLVTNPIDSITVGAGTGGTDIVRIYNPDGTVTRSSLFAFGPDNTSGARVASGDLNADGVQDFVIGTGPGTQARVRAFDGVTLAPLMDFFPFEGFTGGVFVSIGDITGDLKGDIIVTPDQGGGPRVTILDGTTFNRVADFFGIDDPNFRGGARAAVGDVNGDGANDLVVSAGFGGGPRIAAYDGRAIRSNTQVKLFNDFFAFESTLRNGAFVAVGDVDGDGKGDLVLGAGPGGGPRVIAVSGNDLVRSGGLLPTLVANFFAGDLNNRGGVPVAVRTLDADAKADIVTGSGPGGRRVSAYLGASITPNGQPTPSQSIDAFDDNFNPLGGVFVG